MTNFFGFFKKLRSDDALHGSTEEQIIANTDNFNRAAEEYFLRIKDPSYHVNQPFGNVTESPDLLFKLGILLSEMRLGVYLTVVDFGSGTCWVSSFLNRMGMRTIALDVSGTALRLGKELFKKDTRHNWDLEPQFLPYDGHRFPLQSESADRIVCFDAFHHVPNQQEILDEMCRVLKPGGRAGFSEPGPEHAVSENSKYEMEKYGILENNIDLESIWKRAHHAGFTDMIVKPYMRNFSFNVFEYIRLQGGSGKISCPDEVKGDLNNNQIFILKKGKDIFDSRCPGVLRAKIEVSERTITTSPGQRCQFLASVENLGDTLWLKGPLKGAGFVRLGGHLCWGEGRKLIDLDFIRSPLPGHYPPMHHQNIPVEFSAPHSKGRYVIELDMVDEGICWFQIKGSSTVEVHLIVR